MNKKEFTKLTEQLLEFTKDDLQFNLDNEYAINDIDDLFNINTGALEELSDVRKKVYEVEMAIQNDNYEPTELASKLDRILEWTYQDSSDFPIKGSKFGEYIKFYNKK